MRGQLLLATQDGFSAWATEGGTWHCRVTGLADHHLTCLTATPNRFLTGTHEGVWRSDDSGKSWQDSSGGISLPHARWIASHPDDSSVVLLGTEPAGVFLSRDGGESWQQRPEISDFRDEGGWYLPYSPEAGCVRGFAFSGPRAYAAVEQGGMLVSDDTGESWRIAKGSTGETDTPVPRGYIHPDVHSVCVHPSSADLVLAPCGGGFYRSTDGGAHWEQIDDCYVRAVWCDPHDPDHMILGPADGVSSDGRIEVTRDGGDTWEPAWDGLECPWPDDMVDRFLTADDQIVGILSNGKLIAADPEELQWQRIIETETTVEAAAWIAAE
mgnify:FL=1